MKYLKHSIKTSLHPVKDKHYVRMRVTFLGNRVDLSSGVNVPVEKWDKHKGRVRRGAVINNVQYNRINDFLSEMETFVEDYFRSCENRDTMPDANEIKSHFDSKFMKSKKTETQEFFCLFAQYIETVSQTRQWGDSMKEYFVRLMEKLKYYKPNLKFSDLSERFMNGFVEELSKTMYNDAIKKHLSYLKQFMRWAYNRNYGVNKEFFSYSPKLEDAKKDVRYLTIEEFNAVRNCKLDEGGYLDRTRDFFVFQCCTGLRYSDIKQMKPNNIVKRGDGEYDIRILTEKDNDYLTFKLSGVGKAIYMKYRGTQYDGGVLFPVVSNQKYNKYLKELGKKAGLKGVWVDYEFKLGEKIEKVIPKADLTTHTARRTFVVVAMNEGVSLELIAAITSHSDFNAMRPYIKANKKGTDKVIEAFDKAVIKHRNYA